MSKNGIDLLFLHLSAVLTGKRGLGGLFSIVLTHEPRLHVAVNKRSFACRLNCNNHLHNPIIHLFYPPRILHNHNHCLQLLLGHEDVLGEIKNNAYANFGGGGGVKEVYYGICASSE